MDTFAISPYCKPPIQRTHYFSCIRILNTVFISFYLTIMRQLGMLLASLHPYRLHDVSTQFRA